MYDCHELFTEVPELIGRVFTRHFWIILEKLMLPRIKFSSTVNNSIAEYYKDRYKIDMKIIRNLPYYREVQHKIINKLSPENKKVILYQGSVNRGRGVDLAIKAVKLIENAVFVVIGDGDVLEEMKEIVKELQLANKVVFTGRIPFWELHQYTIQADVGLVLEENLGLNYYYSLSNKLFDYIQARVPVLGSPFPEIMNIIENYGVGLIADSHEIAEIAGKINCMLYDSESRITWKNNLNIAAGELCWEKEEKVLLELIKTIQV
jgi:glycosyltransferase involved in cell wall biosynthesis